MSSIPAKLGAKASKLRLLGEQQEWGKVTEINPAEAEAEKILADAYPEARAEACPRGEDCGVHFRVDEEIIENDDNFARLITYVGEYVVMTDDNPEMFTVGSLVGAMLGIGVRIPRWETLVFHVGAEGVLGDITSAEQVLKALRYRKQHDEWDNVKNTHTFIALGVGAGRIDTSKPLEG